MVQVMSGFVNPTGPKTVLCIWIWSGTGLVPNYTELVRLCPARPPEVYLQGRAITVLNTDSGSATSSRPEVWVLCLDSAVRIPDRRSGLLLALPYTSLDLGP